MIRRKLSPWLCRLALCALVPVPIAAQGVQGDSIRVRRVDVPVAGAMLATDLYEGQHEQGRRTPVILVRTPYGRGAWRGYGEFFARRGYVFLAQDVRGRGASTGEHVPFMNEEADGVQLLDWIVAQPWSDGKVGMMGPSYGSFASMVLVARGHPALKAVIDNSGMIDLEELVYTGGAMNLMVGLPWTRLFAGPRASPQQPWDSLFRALPVAASFPGPAAMMAGTDSESAARLRSASALPRLAGRRVPVLHLTGWNDFLYRHTLRAYEAMRSSGAEQVLIVGPWAHDQQQRAGRPSLAGEDFGHAATFGPDSIRATALRWFDRHLRGTGEPASPPVRVFVMGANRWITADRWPLAGAERRTWYLESDGAARGTGREPGRGRLMPRAASSARFDQYDYDPNAPVPTTGGANFHFFTSNLGPLDQRAVEMREDVLSYTTEAFPAPASIVGPLSVTLHVSSTARDADVAAKLVVVRPDGFARIVEDGIVRARYRRSRREPALLTPGMVVPVMIELGATAIVVPAGARLRLEVSAGNFPKYDRNPQSGEEAFGATTLARATHRVHHGGRYASALTVTIVPGVPEMDVARSDVASEVATAPETAAPTTPSAPATSTTPAVPAAPTRPRLAPPPLGAGCLGFSHLNFTVTDTGAVVLTAHPVLTRTTPGGPAISAGLHVGDTLLAIDGRDVLEAGRLPTLTPGRAVTVRVRRDGVREVRVVPGRIVDDPSQPARRDSTGAELPPARVCVRHDGP